MILIGTMNLTRTRDRGEFYCPNCRVQRAYRYRARRPFLTLYFIPTVPIGPAEFFVQCEECRENYDESVLHMDRTAHEKAQAQQFRTEAIRSAVLITLIDNDISEAEISTLLFISETMFQHPMDREELGRLCSIAKNVEIQAGNYVLTVSRGWTMHQRMFALQAMFLAATAGEDDVSPTKMASLRRMRDILELTDREFEAVIDDALNYDTALSA